MNRNYVIVTLCITLNANQQREGRCWRGEMSGLATEATGAAAAAAGESLIWPDALMIH